MGANTGTARAQDKQIVIEREFDAPVELFWKTWTETPHIEKWFGPQGFDTKVNENDFRVGGKFDYVMIGPDGKEYPGVGTFKEIASLKRIVSTDGFSDDFAAANPTLDLPKGAMTVTTLFEPVDDRTKLTIRIDHASVEDRKKHEEMKVVAGWQSSFDKLVKYLAQIKK
ncbi:MAG: SRPBCC domain-containing protein [Pyrinomonadaceae bacterium]